MPFTPHLWLLCLSVLPQVRRTVEPCDSLQSFFLLHSLGGGTGSGLGSYVLERKPLQIYTALPSYL